MKKIISVMLSLIMMLGALYVPSFALTSEEADTHLQYNEDGTIKKVQVH